jgi:NAD(P)-dependent dehydrogenase (short-subunit alcohol dehydrogenase family)
MRAMKIENSVVLVTGANRGIGLALTKAFVARGAAKVYAAARDPKSVTLPGVVALALDVTDPDQVAAAAREASDVTLVINNAGIATTTSLLATDAPAVLRRELETNALGTLAVARAFAPILASHGGGGLVDILSVVSWVSSPLLATYAVSKSAAWSITNGLRNELRPQGTYVAGVHVGFVDTDLTRGIDAPKQDAASVAAAVLDGIVAGSEEIVVDDFSRQIKQSLGSPQAAYLVSRGR